MYYIVNYSIFQGKKKEGEHPRTKGKSWMNPPNMITMNTRKRANLNFFLVMLDSTKTCFLNHKFYHFHLVEDY